VAMAFMEVPFVKFFQFITPLILLLLSQGFKFVGLCHFWGLLFGDVEKLGVFSFQFFSIHCVLMGVEKGLFSGFDNTSHTLLHEYFLLKKSVLIFLSNKKRLCFFKGYLVKHCF